MQTHTSIQQTVTSIMLRLLRRTGRLLLLPSKYPIILRVSSFARFRVELIDSHIPKTCNLCCKSLKAMLRGFLPPTFKPVLQQIRLFQVPKICCRKWRAVLLFATKSVYVAHFTGQGKLVLQQVTPA